MKNSTFVPAYVYGHLKTLRDERLKKGLTIATLGKATGLPSYVISTYEDGQKPTKATYNKLAAFFQWMECDDGPARLLSTGFGV